MNGRLPLLVCFALAGSTLLACKVPVFRYALERWPVDNYRMVAIVQGQQDESARHAIEYLESLTDSHANVETTVIDLETLSDQELWQLEDYDGSSDTPLLQLFYPQKEGQRIKCWEGELSKESISSWLQSPLREQIASDLMSGESAVFLLVEGNDPIQNDQLAERIAESLAIASQQIKIPEGVIPRDQANQHLQQHPESSMDDVLRSDVPLKVSFGLRRVAGDDPEESALLSMVHGLVDQKDEPLLVPIFGRGRMLDALRASECDHDMIINACRYMVGECSCTVKALNPGVDMLLTVDWLGQLGQSVVMIAAERSGTPELVAIPTGDSPQSPTNSQATEWSQPQQWVLAAIGVIGFGLILVGRQWIRRQG